LCDAQFFSLEIWQLFEHLLNVIFSHFLHVHSIPYVSLYKSFLHSSAVKSKNVVTLSVDKTSVEPGIGIPGSSSTDTRDSLIIGDFNRTLHQRRLRGLQTREFYVGCIRNVFINEEEQKLDASQVRGNVTVSVCPTI
jgi:hypothetical protein